MQSTASAIAAAAMSGVDINARAQSSRGSDGGARSSLGGGGATNSINGRPTGWGSINNNSINNSSRSSFSKAREPGFDSQEASNWLNQRWRMVSNSVNDPSLSPGDRPEVHKSQSNPTSAGGGGGAWGANKRTVHNHFTNDLWKAASAAGIK
ncbi:hypothetical protein IE53DRAFT_385545 [Violaceomyces palustris]|uniref:Uncharacterized protein n=1 Tax=Violaceomyces palustris TaxID=1673888 RepID=A0ACD0P225_9BASI|nr:hypothetical protein IE53DRAFT_385545 [Violaceomyces palustris]